MSKTLWLKCFLLLSACLFFGCQARSHLSPTFARNYRLLFNNQVQTTRSMTAPLNARDAKAILMKRDERQSGSLSDSLLDLGVYYEPPSRL